MAFLRSSRRRSSSRRITIAPVAIPGSTRTPRIAASASRGCMGNRSARSLQRIRKAQLAGVEADVDSGPGPRDRAAAPAGSSRPPRPAPTRVEAEAGVTHSSVWRTRDAEPAACRARLCIARHHVFRHERRRASSRTSHAPPARNGRSRRRRARTPRAADDRAMAGQLDDDRECRRGPGNPAARAGPARSAPPRAPAPDQAAASALMGPSRTSIAPGTNATPHLRRHAPHSGSGGVARTVPHLLQVHDLHSCTDRFPHGPRIGERRFRRERGGAERVIPFRFPAPRSRSGRQRAGSGSGPDR